MDGFSEAVLIAAMSLGLFLCAIKRSTVIENLRAFVSEPGHAVNLGAARIVFFATTLFLMPWRNADRWAALPAELVHAPDGTQWLADLGLASPETVRVLMAIMAVSTVTGLVGVFSRSSAGVFALTGSYVMWLPESFGKVDHTHHMLWVALLLAVSPSGDALAIDAIRQRSKGKPPPTPSIEYARPLRVLWVLMGLIYFFPGLLKYMSGGLDWIFTNNLVNHARLTWLSFDEVPAIRIDQWPAPLVWGAAAATILFELGFLFAILFRRTRPWAAIVGFTFHIATHLLMGIAFTSLRMLYLTFVPWHRVLPAIRRQLQGVHRRKLAPPRIAAIAPAHSLRAEENKLVSIRLGSFVSWGLVGVTALMGLTVNMNAWPVAAYPIFPLLDSELVQQVDVTITSQDGTETDLFDSDADIVQWMPRYKIQRLLLSGLDPDLAPAVSRVVSCGLADPPRGITVTSTITASDPDLWDTPVRQETLLAITSTDGSPPTELAMTACAN